MKAPQLALGAGVLVAGVVFVAGALQLSSDAGYAGVGPNFLPLVVGTMQKGTVEQMRSAGFTDEKDRVLIDSGLLFFDAGATTALYGVVLMMAGIAYYILTHVLIRHHGEDSPLSAAIGRDFQRHEVFPVINELRDLLRNCGGPTVIPIRELSDGG